MTLHFLLGPVLASEGVEFSIDETLQNAKFNSIHMPSEQALLAKYGAGEAFVHDGESYRVYYLRSVHLWLRCKVDVDDKSHKPISELMISSIDLIGRKSPKKVISDPNLKGIRIGDNIAKAVKQWGEPLREYGKRLGTKRTTVFEFFPDSLVVGSCLRFFVRDEIVVAFSFSSEE